MDSNVEDCKWLNHNFECSSSFKWRKFNKNGNVGLDRAGPTFSEVLCCMFPCFTHMEIIV